MPSNQINVALQENKDVFTNWSPKEILHRLQPPKFEAVICMFKVTIEVKFLPEAVAGIGRALF